MNNIEEIIGYNFKDKNLLNAALTHASYAHKYSTENNERLEFLGDSVLGFVVAEYLIKTYPFREGELSKIRSRIVSSYYLSEVISKYKLDEFIKTIPTDLSKLETVRCDFFEALLGAIYLDGGMQYCKEFLNKFLNLNKDNIDTIMKETQDYKTKLQEYVQSKKGTVSYKVVGEVGTDNNKKFEIELFVNNKSVCKATGKSKQIAENMCAKIACENLGNLFD